MKTVIGLGNPGTQYAASRHNMGFLILDQLADKLGLEFKEIDKFASLLAEARLKQKKVFLTKPLTYMNNSGEAVQRLKSFYKLENSDFLVIQDEVDLALGQLRVTDNSGSAGHRGIESIISVLGKNFTRLRVGIDNRENKTQHPTDSYVIQDFTEEEIKQVKEKIIPEAIEEIESWIIKR